MYFLQSSERVLQRTELTSINEVCTTMSGRVRFQICRQEEVSQEWLKVCKDLKHGNSRKCLNLVHLHVIRYSNNIFRHTPAQTNKLCLDTRSTKRTRLFSRSVHKGDKDVFLYFLKQLTLGLFLIFQHFAPWYLTPRHGKYKYYILQCSGTFS